MASPSPSPWDIRERLRAHRQEAGLSLARLSAETGLSKTYLLRLETDPAGNPSLDVLARVAEALDLTIADLVGSPALQFDLNEADIPASLKEYATDSKLGHRELQTLASIRWRRGEEPRTSERWRYIHEQLKLSKHFDE